MWRLHACNASQHLGGRGRRITLSWGQPELHSKTLNPKGMGRHYHFYYYLCVGCVHVCAHGNQSSTSGLFYCSLSYSLRQDLSLDFKFSILARQADQWASKIYSLLSSSGHTQMHPTLCGSWESIFRSSFLSSKHYACWAISPVSCIFVVFRIEPRVLKFPVNVTLWVTLWPLPSLKNYLQCKPIATNFLDCVEF